mmetsp:Transcript_3168/g.4037  ORF Transcript_3168/g.4037 Transcript_3168/m.4037 type:complete len:117 (-) Transcript_3168:557-907(-)
MGALALLRPQQSRPHHEAVAAFVLDEGQDSLMPSTPLLSVLHICGEFSCWSGQQKSNPYLPQRVSNELNVCSGDGRSSPLTLLWAWQVALKNVNNVVGYLCEECIFLKVEAIECPC